MKKYAHFDNLLEKAMAYKKTFEIILSSDVKYSQYDEVQSWLLQYGYLIDGLKAIQINPKNNQDLDSFDYKERKKVFMEIVMDVVGLLFEDVDLL